jgi:hypothetical protein
MPKFSKELFRAGAKVNKKIAGNQSGKPELMQAGKIYRSQIFPA